MSGPYRVRGDDEVMRPDGTRLVWCVVDSEAEKTVDELNRLAARSGSPEGWPEGVEPQCAFDLRVYMREARDVKWEAWKFVGPHAEWVEIGLEEVDLWPDHVYFLARRKPKPVTRDVRADEITSRVTLAATDSSPKRAVSRSEVAYAEDGVTIRAIGLRLADTRSGEVLWFGPTDTPAVLVEEPNG